MLPCSPLQPPPSTAALLVELADAYLAQGHDEAARWHAELARKRCIGHDGARRLARLDLALARRQGRSDRLEALAMALGRAPRTGGLPALAGVARCHAALLRGEWSRARRWAADLDARGPAHLPPGTAAHLRGLARLGAGDLDGAESDAAETLSVVKASQDDVLVGESLLQAARVNRILARPRRAEAFLEECRERVGRDLLLASEWWCETARIHLDGDDLGEAEGAARRAVELAQLAGPLASAEALLLRAELRLRTNRATDAAADGARAAAAAARCSPGRLGVLARLFESLAALALGRLDEARACLGPAELLARRLRPDESLLLHRSLAILAREQGLLDEAHAREARAHEAGETTDPRWRRRYARRAATMGLGDGLERQVLLPEGAMTILPEDASSFPPAAFDLWLSLPEGRLVLHGGRLESDLRRTPQLARIVEVLADAGGQVDHGPLFEGVWKQPFDLALNHVNKLQVAVSRLRRKVGAPLPEPLERNGGYRFPLGWRWCVLRDRPRGNGRTLPRPPTRR